jgi:hypothetical protein
MNILNKIDNLLNEKSQLPKKDVLKKVMLTMKSAKTIEQLETAWKMAQQYQKQYNFDLKAFGIDLVNFLSGDWNKPIYDIAGLEDYYEYRKKLITKKGK